MCGGAAFSVASIVTTIVSTAYNSAAAMQQAKAQRSMYNYQADLSAKKLEIAQKNADVNTSLVQDQAAQQSKLEARNLLRVQGAQQAAEAEQGIAGSVTSADIAKDTIDTYFLNQNAIRYNADTKALAIKNNLSIEGFDSLNEQRMARAAGKNAITAGYYKMGSTILEGASQVMNTGASYSMGQGRK